MRIDFNISQTELGKFRTSCEAAIRNVASGTKAAVTDAGVNIMAESMKQVPVDTGTLLSSAYLGVSRRADVAGYKYGAVLGYGEPEGIGDVLSFGPLEWYMVPTNGINPKNKKLASWYASIVHEDLDMPHPRGGKAKFLEDPVRNWASGKFARTAMTYWKQAITYTERSQFSRVYAYGRNTGRFKFNTYKAAHTDFVKQSTGVQRGGAYVRRGD